MSLQILGQDLSSCLSPEAGILNQQSAGHQKTPLKPCRCYLFLTYVIILSQLIYKYYAFYHREINYSLAVCRGLIAGKGEFLTHKIRKNDMVLFTIEMAAIVSLMLMMYYYYKRRIAV